MAGFRRAEGKEKGKGVVARRRLSVRPIRSKNVWRRGLNGVKCNKNRSLSLFSIHSSSPSRELIFRSSKGEYFQVILKGNVEAPTGVWAYTDAQGLNNLFQELGTYQKPWKDKLEKMAAEIIKAEKLSGNALLESVAQKLSKIDEEIRYPSTTGGCFAKGTRVHTKEGLKRIEEIKVGDYVLSSPEDGTGGADYKRVLNVFVHKDKTIRHITGYGPNNDEPYFLAATGNHPFWVEGVGWTRADELKPDDVLRKADGRFTDISRQRPVYRTQQEGVGWVQELTDVEGSYGTLFDYANYAVVPDDGKAAYLSDEVYASDDPYLKVDVYNLEVEDYHTYYVSGVGVWVHNTNCLGVELSNGNGVLPDSNVALYESGKVLDDAIAKGAQAVDGFCSGSLCKQWRP